MTRYFVLHSQGEWLFFLPLWFYWSRLSLMTCSLFESSFFPADTETFRIYLALMFRCYSLSLHPLPFDIAINWAKKLLNEKKKVKKRKVFNWYLNNFPILQKKISFWHLLRGVIQVTDLLTLMGRRAWLEEFTSVNLASKNSKTTYFFFKKAT